MKRTSSSTTLNENKDEVGEEMEAGPSKVKGVTKTDAELGCASLPGSVTLGAAASEATPITTTAIIEPQSGAQAESATPKPTPRISKTRQTSSSENQSRWIRHVTQIHLAVLIKQRGYLNIRL